MYEIVLGLDPDSPYSYLLVEEGEDGTAKVTHASYLPSWEETVPTQELAQYIRSWRLKEDPYAYLNVYKRQL